ncbi:HAH_0734 family protein [Haloarcula litorea]|uniref:HAH_0734 family protein n=1 Tax=Haloarcula litorea TaxID=3032579 RepID=UPI0023E79EC4|nr:HAH_0734 family protein [Halomicroarcula sp. GDY20]
MKKLIVHGDAGFRKGGRIEYDGEEYEVFAVARQGEWHGPDEPQLWCTVGSEDEQETFDKQDYIPIHLDTENVDAEAVTVVRERGEPDAEAEA